MASNLDSLALPIRGVAKRLALFATALAAARGTIGTMLFRGKLFLVLVTRFRCLVGAFSWGLLARSRLSGFAGSVWFGVLFFLLEEGVA